MSLRCLSLVTIVVFITTEVTVSTETCGKDLLEGTSCIFKLPEKNNVKSNDIKWSHTSSDTVVERKREKIKSNKPDIKMDEDGSFRFLRVSLDDTGTYIYRVTTADGVETDKGQVEIKVYAKVPKPIVKFSCTTDGTATLICDTGNNKDLTVSWYKDDKMIQKDKNSLLLSPTQVQENKLYSCEAINPFSKEKSESITVSCVHVMKVGDQVSFRLVKTLPSPVTSIIWKHINSDGFIDKVIEWDDEGFNIPNQRFKGITTLDVKTGQITITDLKVEHSGVYTIDINTKEQEQRFTLTVTNSNRGFVIWIAIVLICMVFIILFLFKPHLYGFCVACCGRRKTSRK